MALEKETKNFRIAGKGLNSSPYAFWYVLSTEGDEDEDEEEEEEEGEEEEEPGLDYLQKENLEVSIFFSGVTFETLQGESHIFYQF